MDQWEQVSGIVRTTLALEPHARGAYLDATCAGNDALRRQVDALLATADDTRTVASPLRLLPSGSVFAHYRILGELGAGGMGVVYRARDERLDRNVAVKVLPPSAFGDPTARARLVREAKAAAALNHPNVCTVHEVGEANGQAYIAMELVEGETLTAKLAARPLSLGRLLNYGRQLADALTHAHDRGVVHRDLKSNNVIVTPDERVKVLDFGLAKRLSDADLGAAATETQQSLTQPGTAAGTLPYMSPEQLRGGAARSSSDIWALGVVLYEMASGLRPFTGQTAFEVSAAILGQSPPPLPSTLPPALDELIARCLEKEPDRRFRTAAELRTALEAIPATAGPAPTDVETRPAAPVGSQARARVVHLPSRRAVLISAAVALVVVGTAGAWRFWPRPVRTLAVLPFVNVSKDADTEYLSSGIAEALIVQISRQATIAVSNLPTVLPFKDRVSDPGGVGRELGVATVVTGSVEQQGAQLLVAAQLLDVGNGQQLWSGRYDRKAVELLDVQNEVALAIVNALRVRMSRADQQRLVKHPTTDGDAYDLYLQARHIQRSATEEDYLYSRELLQRAVLRDPKFALGYAALSGNHAMMVVDGLERPIDAWAEVSKYMNRALAIDPTLPDIDAYAHAMAFLWLWDWAETERARRRVLQYPLRELDPHVLRALAVEHWALGRPAEALQLARRMRELDPSSPYLGTLEADYLINNEQYDAAVPLYERAIRLDPTNLNSYFGLAEARAGQRRFDEAIEARRQVHRIAGDEALNDVLATAKGEEGYRAIQRRWVLVQLEMLKARQATSYTSPLEFARVYAQLGDKEQAFKHLDAAFLDRSPGLVFLKVDRAWDLVRDDSRFLEAIRKVGLP
ncbi:MAG TPA: protein kinase [Vicinamibacterales bacterium]|nr:protein kinase [Vicinamibacterales bacterium]